MMYPKAHVELARENVERFMDCPEWMKQMFAECPTRFTLIQSSGSSRTWQRADTVRDDNFPNDLSRYRMSEEWPPENHIISVPVPILEIYECEVSDDGYDWNIEEVVGVNDGAYLTREGETYAYARETQPRKHEVTLEDGTIVQIDEELHEKLKNSVKFN